MTVVDTPTDRVPNAHLPIPITGQYFVYSSLGSNALTVQWDESRLKRLRPICASITFDFWAYSDPQMLFSEASKGTSLA